MNRRRIFDILAVTGLTLLALAARLYLLREIPFGLHNDEAANGLDALAILNGHHAIFFPANSGREAIFLYLQAAAMAVLGVEPYALRVPAAIIGALTVPAVYWMVREAFDRVRDDARWLALWTAALVGLSYWHLAFSRLGYRGILVPATTALALACFWRAWYALRERATRPWTPLILTGILLGVGLHTYIAARVAPLLVALLLLIDIVQQRADRAYVRRALAALAVITVSATIVFLPLGLYFAQHPEFLGSRAAAVSIFSPDFNGGSPLRAMARSAFKFAAMFVTGADLNERHNPAERPLLGVILSGWVVIGLLGALWRWRVLPYLAAVLWVGLFALPSLLTLQGIPHSLRAIGMIPAVYLLIVLGMLFVADWLGRRQRWSQAQTALFAALLPLPFVLFSGATGVYDYFSAWASNDRLPFAFHTSYVELMQEMAANSGPDEAWVIPLTQQLFAPGTTNYTMDFAFDGMAQGKAGHAVIVTEPISAAAALTDLARTHPLLNLVTWPNRRIAVEGAYLQADEKGIFPFLLGIYGEELATRQLGDIAYTQYRVPPGTTFEFAPGMQPVNVRFGDAVRLTGVAWGGAFGDQGSRPQDVAAGGDAWVVLRWEAQRPVSETLKAGLRLLSSEGNDAGRADQLLLGDGYPFETTWPAGKTTYTYHSLPTRAGIPPDDYALAVTVYDDASGSVLPGHVGSGTSLAPIAVAPVHVTRATKPAIITPDSAVESGAFATGKLALLGYDLPLNESAPGARLPLTLYWQAMTAMPDAPTATQAFALRLLGPDGVSLDETRAVALPPDEPLAAGDVQRDWQDIRIPTDAAGGSYALLLDDGEGAQLVLAELVIAGRPRVFEPPPLAQTSDGHFGDFALLRGLEVSLPEQAVPGATLEVPLVWEAQRDGDQPQVRFVHVLNAAGQLIAQQDAIPCDGDCPTESWLTGEILRDVARVTLPSELPPGKYAVVVGFYDPATAARAPATDGLGQRLESDVYFLPGRMPVE